MKPGVAKLFSLLIASHGRLDPSFTPEDIQEIDRYAVYILQQFCELMHKKKKL